LAEAFEQLEEVATAMDKKCAKAAVRLREASREVLAYMAFPQAHWRQIHSTNPLERLHKEIRRRTRVVDIFPNELSYVRLVGILLAEQDDEWQAAERAYFSQASMARLTGGEEPPLLMKETATG
jgi:putative transposase